MPLYPPSHLDADQVLQHAFDEDTQRLRVDSEATLVAGAFEVAIDHTTDSIKLGDGTTLVNVTLNNELKTSDNDTHSLLTQIRDNTDNAETLLSNIDSNTDTLENLITTSNSLLTTIRDNADTVETLLGNIDSNTDGLETLITTTNSLLTTIRDNADTVETLLTNIGNNTDDLEGFVDGLEGLLTTTNSLLTTIRDNADQLEGYLDGVEGLLTTIRDNADQLEGFLDTVESLLTAGNSSLSSIDSKLSTTNSSLASIDAGIPVALGQTTMANSMPVVIASNQSPIQVVGNVASETTDNGNPVKTGGVFNSTLPTVTTGQRIDSQYDQNGRQIINSVPSDGYKATYSAGITGLIVANTATDIFTITGSSTKTIRVTRIEVTGTQTNPTNINLLCVKRSTANSGGTSTAPTAVPHDSSNAAATATILAYTANPTTGTLVGTIRTQKICVDIVNKPSTATPNYFWDFGIRPSKAIVLRGTSEVLAINLNSQTVAGNSFNINIEWTEE